MDFLIKNSLIFFHINNVIVCDFYILFYTNLWSQFITCSILSRFHSNDHVKNVCNSTNSLILKRVFNFKFINVKYYYYYLNYYYYISSASSLNAYCKSEKILKKKSLFNMMKQEKLNYYFL